jgi:hypothetical protein
MLLPEEWDSSAKYTTSSSANNEGQGSPSRRGVTEDCSEAHRKDKISGLHLQKAKAHRKKVTTSSSAGIRPEVRV